MTDDDANIGDRERRILQLVRSGRDDFHRLREQLALSWRQVDYSLDKLEDAGLVDIRHQDGFTTREVNGQRRKFKAPRKIDLTDDGRQYVKRHEAEQEYADLSREELVAKIHRLEQRVDELETGFQSFKKQVKRQLS